jgi:hypothetical protein
MFPNFYQNRTNKDKLFFKPINEDFVTKQINKLNIKKATGYDGISPKIIKFAQPVKSRQCSDSYSCQSRRFNYAFFVSWSQYSAI